MASSGTGNSGAPVRASASAPERSATMTQVRLLANELGPGMNSRHSMGALARLVAACSLLIVVIGAGSVLGETDGGAATSGWYVATVPGTGADNVVLGSSCANALQCMSVGLSIENISSGNSTFSPLVESWNGSSWSLGAAPLPAGDGGGFFNVSCVNGSDCWAVGAVLGVPGNGNPTGTLIENWNGASWSIVPSPTPTGTGVVGAVLQGVSCTSASNCVAVGFSTDQNGENVS